MDRHNMSDRRNVVTPFRKAKREASQKFLQLAKQLVSEHADKPGEGSAERTQIACGDGNHQIGVGPIANQLIIGSNNVQIGIPIDAWSDSALHKLFSLLADTKKTVADLDTV